MDTLVGVSMIAFGIATVTIAPSSVDLENRLVPADNVSRGSIVVRKLIDKGDPNFGFDAQSGEYKDMVPAGIIDPTKMVRIGLQDAASVAVPLEAHRRLPAPGSSRAASSRTATIRSPPATGKYIEYFIPVNSDDSL